MYRTHIILLLLVTMLSSVSQAAFTDIGAPVVGAAGGDIAWGDYDNDGDLDLALTGLKYSGSVTTIYRCEGGTLVDSGVTLPGAQDSSLAWGDYDNDGDLDLVLVGYIGLIGGTHITRIYRNTGGSFTDIEAGLEGAWSTDTAWGDYDNDGDLDLFVGGPTTSRVYRNDEGAFVDIGASLLRVYSGSVAWGDYDNDGDLDLALTSMDSSITTKIYRNDAGVFVDTLASIVGVYNSSLAWGDYDNDGDLDLAISGRASVGFACRIYRNDEGTFTDANAGLPTDTPGPLCWGDVDNDGDLDLVLVRESATEIYENDGGSFVATGETMLGSTYGGLALGDYDNDGDLDLAVLGRFPTGVATEYKSVIYRNDSTVANTAPTAPTGLAAGFGPDGLSISWSAASDAETPSAGLSYNVRVGTTPGGSEISSGMAHSSGLRKVVDLGNAQQGSSWRLSGLRESGTYYYSVQAVDSAFAGSPWAPEQQVQVTVRTISGRITTHDGASVAGACVSASNGGQVVLTDPDGFYSLAVPDGWNGTVTPAKTGYWFSTPTRTYSNITVDQTDQDFTASTFTDAGAVLTGVADARLAWGDYDGDGDLDLAVAGRWLGNYSTRVYRNTKGAFTDIGASMTGVSDGSLAWGDYDNDGDLDLLVAGMCNGGPFIGLYENDSGTFTRVWPCDLPAISACAVAWVDYDNDGDLDVALAGSNINGTRITKIYRNTEGTFADSGAVLPGASDSGMAWGDYDNDGDLDLALSGYGPGSKIYRNDGGMFADISADLQSVSNGSLDWGDYDNDGDLDLLLTGYYYDGSRHYICRVYRNDDGTFVDANASIRGVSGGVAAWGDWDNDGDLDLAITGAPYLDGRCSVIYRNDDGVFREFGPVLPSLSASFLAWGDYDKDGDLDLALAGDNGTTAITAVFKNDMDVPNSAPTPPTGLSASGGSAGFTFSWSPATDTETPAAGLSYNIRIGTSPGACDVFSGMASSIGRRYVPALGNAQKRLSWTIGGLSLSNTYYWSVQAVDTAFAGSPWSAEQTFTPDITPPSFVRLSVSPTLVAPGESILVTAEVMDDRGLASVVMDGDIPMTHVIRHHWRGSLSALSAPGDHTVTVTATDTSGNTSTATAQYTTLRVLGIVCRDAPRAANLAVGGACLFRLWGTVEDIEESGFSLNDGSGTITVVAPKLSGLEHGDLVSVTGSLSISGEPILTTTPEQVKKLATTGD